MQITLHLPTAAITVAIGSLALFGMSASAPQAPSPDRDVQAVEDIGRPSIEDLVWIYSGSGSTGSYTVPAGKSLVLTGFNGFGNYLEFNIDGGPNRIIATYEQASVSLFSGIPLAEGQTITLTQGTGSLFGHLVDV